MGLFVLPEAHEALDRKELWSRAFSLFNSCIEFELPKMLIAVAIFLVAYVIIATERLPRHWVALVGSALLIVFGILNPMEAFNYVNWETLGLLLGMFFLVAILIESGFFSWLSLTIVQKANYHPGRVFFLLPLVAALMATLMDSITVMLFFSALTYQLCKLL